MLIARLRVASRRFAVRVGLAALLTIWPTMAQAQGPPIKTQNAFVTGLSGAGFRTFFLGFDRSGLRLDGNKIADPLERQVHVRGEMFVLPYELVSNRLVVMAVLPYLNKTLEMGLPGNRQEMSVSGFGDLAVAAKLGIWVYPGFPTIFRGLSGFFVGDLRKRPCGSSWKTRSVFQGAVGALCASTAPSASTGPVRVRQNGSRGGNGELDRRRPRTAVDP